MKTTTFALAAVFIGAAMILSQVAHAQDIAPAEPVTTTETAISTTLEVAPQRAAATHFIFASILMKPAVQIANGNFDAGRVAWTESSAKGSLPLIRTTFVGSVTPRSPAHASWLGGAYNDTQTLQQVVTVPGGQPYLAYYHWIASSDYCGYDFASVRVNGAAVTSYDLCDPNDTNGWAKKVVNLSAYAGQQVTLQIRVTTDGSKNSNLFIDDVTFQAGANVSAAGADDGQTEIQVESFTQNAPAEKPEGDLPDDATSAHKTE